MSADFNHRLPQNTPGKFYVDDQCLDCDLCRDLAPKNFKRWEEGGYSYVSKQPETDEELGLCMEVVRGCPLEAVGLDGDQNNWNSPLQRDELKPWWKFW
jgi:ferredoxin